MNKVQIDEICMERVNSKEMVGVFSNATAKYLAPCLKWYGDDLKYWLNNTYKVGIGVGDMIVNRCGMKFKKHLFLLVDTSKLTEYFLGFISWVRKQQMYEDDYVYGNIQNSSLHMVVIRFPEQLYSIFDSFYIGQYSKMFTPEQIELFFNDHPGTKRTLIKDSNYKVKFLKKLNRDWGTNIKPEEWDGVLDTPPEKSSNIFNNHINNII